ncbi:rod shape-determining protein MreC [Patescibacteria group bacterium]|nr:MAG: rod shape-determining protein MreC [Patescibacteria group bacterium]
MKPRLFGINLSKMVLIVAAFGLLVFLNPYKLFSPVRSVGLYIIYPFQKLAYAGSLKIARAREFLGSIGRLKQENTRLTEENQRISAENAALADAARENDFLREQLRLLPREQFSLEAAYIISRDPYGAGNWIEISKGDDYGITTGMPVIVSESVLVGRVGEVHSHSAQIILITNSESLVNALDAETGARGVVHGEYNMGIALDLVLPSDTLNPGERVITSGTSEGVPRGLYLGKIDSVTMSSDGLFRRAKLEAPVRLNMLQTVFVITQSR